MRLESLHIKNYKLFKDLEIPKLGQVNLITGKNNTGKTILLEALRIWASEGDASVVNNIIWKRGDWDEGSLMKSCATLFYGSENKLTIKSFIKIEEYDIGPVLSENHIYLQDLYIKERTNPNHRKLELFNAKKEFPQDVAIYVPASIDFDNKALWKDIVFNRKRKDVIKVLKTIDERISDIEIVDNKAFVGLENVPNLVPLKNFGEGLNRLLTIAMALVSAEDNLLLIDEIDTGLHYSVLEKLWEIIFEFSTQLNTQVFVTTHSGDCVDAFSTVANQERFKGVGNYFRLSRKEEGVVAVEYDIDELEMALESNIETR